MYLEERLPSGIRWRSSMRFATADQQAWWDALSDQERVLVVRAAGEPAPTPGDAAIWAQVLEHVDRRVLSTPWPRIGAVLAVLVLIDLAFGIATAVGEGVGAMAPGTTSIVILWVVLHHSRRLRWTRIDEHRALAASLGVPTR